MTKLYVMLLSSAFICFFSNGMEPDKKWHIKFTNSSGISHKIQSVESLLHSFRLLIQNENKGYLLKENGKFHLCVWDKYCADPQSIHPLYKGTLEITDSYTQDSSNVFYLKNVNLNEIMPKLTKAPISRSIKKVLSIIELYELLEAIFEGKLLIQL